MSAYQDQVNRQYGREALSDKILAALEAAGKDLDNLTREDLSSFDEFHIGGIMETRNMASKIPGLAPGARLLDIGSGLGGPARTLAAEFGASVVGIDLTEAYCDAATTLTDLVGLGDRARFEQADALDMPFEDDSFDIVWTQFVGMNIEDKRGWYAQCKRVLKPGGHFAFHEVMQGPQPGLVFPVFWADTDDVNFLQSAESVQGTLDTVGFERVVWDDMTAQSVSWFEKILEAQKQQTGPALSFKTFVGDDTPVKAANVIQNIKEGHASVVQGVYRA